MNNTLATITPHGWILALFIRDDDERLLLGDGYYEFKEEQRHFVANTYINDVVELQGTDGQLIAGQVRRSQAQPFDGYICDPTIDQATTEQKRRDFFLFFRKNHEYKVVYIFPNGEAIQRKGGYIVDAPEIREIIQRSPEYHVALAFEDVNYYTYAEDETGAEIYSYETEIAPASAADGGLVWDEKGMVSDGQSLELYGINGDTFQQSYSGKNLISLNGSTAGGLTSVNNQDGTITISGTATASTSIAIMEAPREIEAGTYTLTISKALPFLMNLSYRGASFRLPAGATSVTTTATSNFSAGNIWVAITQGVTYNETFGIQLTQGSTPDTDFEPFVGGQPSPNPDYPQPIQTVTGSQTIAINGTNYPLDLGTIELCKLDTYHDRIYKDGSDWKIHKEIGKITFDSATSWTKHSSTNGNVFMLGNTGLIGYAYGSGTAAPAVMNTDTAIALGSVPDRAYGVFGINNTTQIRVFRGVYNSSYTAATFKSEMIGKSIYGALVDATDTTITDQALIAQLEAIRTALAGGGKITITPTGDNLAVKLDTTPTGTGGLIWEASSGGAPITVEIQGVDKTYPILEITGPAVDPVLTNITTGEEFHWTGTVPEDQTLRIDMREMTATLNGANVFEFVSGSWVGFDPGPNTVRYTAALATYPAKIYYNEVVG